jgi:hypothetical protein
MITRIASDGLELEFVGPTEPPDLTPRLARALLRAITNVKAQPRSATMEAVDHTRQREPLAS